MSDWQLDGQVLACYTVGVAERRRLPINRDVLASVMSELGKRGGRARAERLTRQRRREIARLGGAATKARWARKKAGKDRAKIP